MKAKEIQPGDRFGENYVVLEVERDTVPSHDKVYATVQYRDGGTDRRAWLADDEVPLTRDQEPRTLADLDAHMRETELVRDAEKFRQRGFGK
jgi:hypothetical protein